MKSTELRANLEALYSHREAYFIAGTGLPYAELKSDAFALADRLAAQGESRIVIRARLLAFLLDNAELGFCPDQPFADLINCEGILSALRSKWQSQVKDAELEALSGEARAAQDAWFYRGLPDYGHLCPDWDNIISLGLPGLLARVEDRDGELYEAIRIIYSAIIRVASRLAELAEKYDKASAAKLRALCERAPTSASEAFGLITLMFRIFEYVDGERIRSLGGVDRLLLPFCKTDADFRDELTKFLLQVWSMRVPFDLPMFIGGKYASGFEEAYEVAKIIVEVYSTLDIYSPKIHVRICEGEGSELIRLVCESIRSGNSSFVFISDETAAKALELVGIEREDAWNYVPIGCYEPAAYRKEIPCTGNGKVSLAKAVLLALFDGYDIKCEKQLGPHTGNAVDFGDFERFYEAVRAQLTYAIDRATTSVRAHERHYAEVYPIPMLSATFDSCLESGRDALDGGAKYNNCSLSFMGIATAADSLYSVKCLFDDAKMPIARLLDALRADWNGYEDERLYFLGLAKYGNNVDEVDSLARRLAGDAAELMNRPNARGGRFKPGLFSIDHCHPAGRVTAATPDGRHAGEPLSKNLCPTAGVDKNGITAVLLSCVKLGHELFANGSVLDVMLHPTSVAGDEGLAIFEGLIRTYFRLGGFALHGNIISAETLEAAQADPKEYANLQVRLCGWNVYFANLSKAEQDELIRAAK